MFSGIVSDVGMIRTVEQHRDLRLLISCGSAMGDLALGTPISCAGACLTVVDRGERWFSVDVSEETLSRTARGQWEAGNRLNLERALHVGDELGGHIVTGHVDAVATVIHTEKVGSSTLVEMETTHAIGSGVAPKGSIALDGVSLTVNEVEDIGNKLRFTINIIPHTAARTTLGDLAAGQQHNVESDVLARYVQRMAGTRIRPGTPVEMKRTIDRFIAQFSLIWQHGERRVDREMLTDALEDFLVHEQWLIGRDADPLDEALRSLATYMRHNAEGLALLGKVEERIKTLRATLERREQATALMRKHLLMMSPGEGTA